MSSMVESQSAAQFDEAPNPFPFSGLRSIGPVYAFLDLEHPAVAWAVMRGMLVSASHAFASPGFISFMQAGMIAAGNNARIFNEAIIELYQANYFPELPSRMRSMYFFGSRAEAEVRIGDKEWPPYFTADNLLELELFCDAVPTIVDANWITFARIDEATGRIPIDNLDWMSKYWRGKKYNESPVWEALANGIALVPEESVRRRCNKFLEDTFPQSHIPILMARLASEVGTRGGLTHPFLLRRDTETVELAYLWCDAEFHDPHVIQTLIHHPDFGKLAKMMQENESWNMVDLRPWGKVFKVGIRPIPELGDFIIPSVHDNGNLELFGFFLRSGKSV